MTVNIANVEVSTDNFAAWIGKTNQMIEAFRHQVVTVSNSSVSTTTGNAVIIGRFTSDILVANSSLRGGNNSTSNTLTIISNVVVSNVISVQGLKIQNTTANITISIPTAAQQANTQTFLHANGQYVYVDIQNTNNALYLGGVPAAEYMNIDANYIIDGIHTHNANIVINEALIANGSPGLNGYILKSTGTDVYWAEAPNASAGGSDTYVQFNDGTALGGVAGWSFNKTTNTYSLGNSTINSVSNSSTITLSNSTVTTTYSRNGLTVGISAVNSTVVSVGANVIVDATGLKIGNSTVNVVHSSAFSSYTNATHAVSINPISILIGNAAVYQLSNSSSISIANSTAMANLTMAGLAVGVISVNASSITAGANVLVNSNGISIGNSTANIVSNSTVISKNGASIIPFGQHTLWIPAGAITPRTSNGASASSYEMTTNKVMVRTLDFDSTSEEFGQFSVQFPKSWDLGTLVAQCVWTQANTTTNYGVVWGIQAVAFADSDPMDTAFGTVVNMTDTGGTNNNIYISPESSALTVAGSPTAEEVTFFQIKRVVGDASDTMAVDARLIGVKIHYTTNAASDS